MKWHSQATRTALLVLFGALANVLPLTGAPAHPHPYLMPPAEKQRLVDRLRSNESARRQFETIKAQAREGKFADDAALAFALEGDAKFSEVVRRHLLKVIRERSKDLDEDIAAGGHRERNMEFYWDTAEIRAYDLVYPALPPEERKSIETFYRKLGHYWKDSLSRWTTTPNLVFPIAIPVENSGPAEAAYFQCSKRCCGMARCGMKPRFTLR
jgi:hypothetical protein